MSFMNLADRVEKKHKQQIIEAHQSAERLAVKYGTQAAVKINEKIEKAMEENDPRAARFWEIAQSYIENKDRIPRVTLVDPSETLSLVKHFTRISSPEDRQKIIDLARALSVYAPD